MPQIRKEVKKHRRLCLRIGGRDTYVTTIAIFADKCEHNSLRTSLAPFCNDATTSLDHVQEEKRYYILYSRSKQQEDKTGFKGLCE